MVIIQAIVNALASAFDMLWEVLWPLALGFLLSAIVQTLVSRNAVARTLGSDSPRSLGFATLLGAASSSCSYADVAIAEGPFLRRLFSGRALTAISHNFWMDVTSVWTDIGLGLLIAGALAVWVPASFWQGFFLTSHPVLSEIWGPLIGPVISLLSFVCSVGNVPLAAVLWNGGISFGGVIAFIFADLIIIPILNIYRKYYGRPVALYLLGVSYAAMALAGLLIGLLFKLLGIVPAHHAVIALQTGPTLNYTSVLNVIFLGVMALLGWRFLRTGGLEMLRMMEGASVSSADDAASQHHGHH